ncbi:hypothetical protein EV359DRAFT_66595 [Lentinula novae-zelandiae]|nr:hypothetical protein EV359DRAFT_66595 [Lentinula novae-zelandiae]
MYSYLVATVMLKMSREHNAHEQSIDWALIDPASTVAAARNVTEDIDVLDNPYEIVISRFLTYRMLGYVDEQALPFSDMITTTKVTEAVKSTQTIMRNSMYCLLTTGKDRLTFSSLENVWLSLIEAWKSRREFHPCWIIDIDGVVSPPMSFNSNSCMTLYIMSGLTFAIGICGSQVVLLWRVWTLWNYSAKMTFVFTGLFLCGSVFNLVIFISTRTAEGSTLLHFLGTLDSAPCRYLVTNAYTSRVLSPAVFANHSREALYILSIYLGLLIPFQHVMETILTSRAIIHWKRQSQKSQTTTALDLTGTSFAEVFEASNESASIPPHPSSFRRSGSTNRYSLEEPLINLEDPHDANFVNGSPSLDSDTPSQNNMDMGSLYSELIEDGNPRLFPPSPSRESEIIRRSLMTAPQEAIKQGKWVPVVTLCKQAPLMRHYPVIIVVFQDHEGQALASSPIFPSIEVYPRSPGNSQMEMGTEFHISSKVYNLSHSLFVKYWTFMDQLVNCNTSPQTEPGQSHITTQYAYCKNQEWTGNG